MSLKVKKNIKRYIAPVVTAILVLVVAAFVIRVAVWEHNYYAEKEGSNRAVTALTGDVSSSTENIDVEEVSDDAKNAYVVSADMPRFLSIPRLNVDRARILKVGTMPSGEMATPSNIYDAGWWTSSSKPGTGGVAILDGHSGAGVAGIFDRLPDLQPGDLIEIELGDGSVLTYRTYDNITVPLAEANTRMHTLAISPISGTEAISIITCTGEWSYNQNTFTARQFLRATLIRRTTATHEVQGGQTNTITIGN